MAGENGRNDFYGETGCCPRQIKFPHSEASVGGQGHGLRGKNRAGVYGRHDCMKRYSAVSIRRFVNDHCGQRAWTPISGQQGGMQVKHGG